MKNRSIRQFLLAVCVLAPLAGWAADDGAPADYPVHFRDGSEWILLLQPSHGFTTGLTETYRVVRAADRASVPIESIDPETHQPKRDPSGLLECFEVYYDTHTDLLSCNSRGGAGAWFVEYYRAAGGVLQLQRTIESRAGSDKEIVHYQRKSH